VIGDLKEERGVTFEAEIDLVESLGSHLYACFHIESEACRQTARRHRRRASTKPARAKSDEQVVARLDPISKVKRRETAQPWADTSKLHLVDPESGESLRGAGSSDSAPPAMKAHASGPCPTGVGSKSDALLHGGGWAGLLGDEVVEAEPGHLVLNDRHGLEMQPEGVPKLLERFGLVIGGPVEGALQPT